jgi:CheY-like chemotaxis protein
MENKKFTILIIEDQKFSTNLFRAALAGYYILSAESGIEGVKIYEDSHPNIVFLDIGLPDVSGFEVLEKLRQFDPEACVVMLSGMNNDTYIQRCKELGAMGFLSKPYQKDYITYYIGLAKEKYRL